MNLGRDYFMYYRIQAGFLAIVLFGSFPLPSPSPPSLTQQVVSHSESSWTSLVELTDWRGERRGEGRSQKGAKSYDGKKVKYTEHISSFHTIRPTPHVWCLGGGGGGDWTGVCGSVRCKIGLLKFMTKLTVFFVNNTFRLELRGESRLIRSLLIKWRLA